ncbi:MAG TPA: SRPBCC family protein, partial [Pyrinomonadaceae bacterium]
MRLNQYHFTSRWSVEGRVEEVADIIEDAAGLTRWWPSVYLSVEVLEPGAGAHGVGRVTSLHAKGWLPYTLRWKLRTVESRYPHGFTVEAFEGDFRGVGVWTFEQDGRLVRVGFDWRIRSEKPLIRALTFLLKPVFSFNHRWTMRRGEESLKL